jgi:aminoglycoside phosphotransferase family enzyme/predicted kinase
VGERGGGAVERLEEEIVAALAKPDFYPHRPARVEHLQTHISHVFLAEPFAYKLKKSVRFDFLDFSTVERRRFYCDEEVRLNARLSPDVYLGVVPVTRAADGALALDGDGEPVAHLVWMRALPAARRLVELVERDALEVGVLDRLAVRLVEFHSRAAHGPEIAAHADPEAIGKGGAETVDALARYVGTVLSAEEHAVLADFGPSFIRRHETLLRARQAGGRICEGHGDLHAEHVYDLDRPLPGAGDAPPLAAGIYLVDCLEFSQPLRCNDVVGEIAFLAMDLDRLGRPDLARRFLTAYAEIADDPMVGTLAPFYSYRRACVRALVALLKSEEPEVDPAARAAAVAAARRYLVLAGRYAWSVGKPIVIVCSGLSGSGKSALAGALAEVTGFPIVATDAIRKADGADAPAYTVAARAAVYEQLCRKVHVALAAGHGVIADGTFLRRAHRERLARVARICTAGMVFLECHAPEDVIRHRLDARDASSLSDARWATYVEQRQEYEQPQAEEPVVRIATGGNLDASLAAALRVLWSRFRGS